MSCSDPPQPTNDLGPLKNPIKTIFITSILSLFLEMMLIRWIGTEVRIFAYLQNTILVVCFLGMGLGCFTCRHPIVIHQILVPLLIIVLLLAIPITRFGLGEISNMLSLLSDLVIWGSKISRDSKAMLFLVFAGLLATYVLLTLILDIFVPIGRLLGRLLDEYPNTIWAYSVNVFGSLLGIWLFVLCSAVYQPPLVWFLIVGSLTLLLLYQQIRPFWLNIALLLCVLVSSWLAGQETGALKVIWSPYQKLVLREVAHKPYSERYVITVNNTFYQTMFNINASIGQGPFIFSSPEKPEFN